MESYLIVLKEHLEKDHILNSKTLSELEILLNNEIDQLTKKSSSAIKSQNFDVKTILFRRSRMRAQTAKASHSKNVTISLDTRLNFSLPVERSFSMGQHPIVVSLVDSYSETFFCQGRDNGVILLSSLSIDVYTRSSGFTWSIPLSVIFGNMKDRIFTGVWCSYHERLILVGRYHFYLFDLDRHRIRCVCKCGCGARCIAGTMRPKPRQHITPRYRYPEIIDDRTDSQRFFATNHNGTLFYGKFE